jgi:polysaccharide deacetylase 2 family uncharacterized protein YibQ
VHALNNYTACEEKLIVPKDKTHNQRRRLQHALLRYSSLKIQQNYMGSPKVASSEVKPEAMPVAMTFSKCATLSPEKPWHSTRK